MDIIRNLIGRYKQLRSRRFLAETCEGEYAFVGIGSHSLHNLYPVLHHLQVPVKYIVCTSAEKAGLIGRKYRGVTATTSLDRVLSDRAIRGVFVSASPRSHFRIAQQVLESGKALFIEKPPCETLDELRALASLEQKAESLVTVGLQKRHAPCTAILKKQLRKSHALTYALRYQTGLYPEGDALLDLYIHPLDLVTHLFGKAEIVSLQHVASDRKGGATLLLTLRHERVVGTLELSTNYSWTNASECLSVNAEEGVFVLSQMESLTFEQKSSSLLGVPLEKICTFATTTKVLFARNNFNPVLYNNQVYSQGYYDEIHEFVRQAEKKARTDGSSGFASLLATYELMEGIRARL